MRKLNECGIAQYKDKVLTLSFSCVLQSQMQQLAGATAATSKMDKISLRE